MSANSRDRKAARVRAKVAAFGVYSPATRSWHKTPAARCTARDKNGHRCHYAPDHHANHSAFGSEWPR
ncbi:MAG: hypothetical protein WAN48_10740 [Actinomycetes bacterium]